VSSDKTPAHKLIQGTPFGAVYPARAAAEFPAIDGRTAGLRVLRRYISELTFHRPGDAGSPRLIPFRIPLDDIHVEQPDNVVNLLKETKPGGTNAAVVFVPGAGQYLPVGLSTFLEEETRDKFGKDTALQVQSEYQENVTLECWATDKPTRRAMVAGLEAALVPTEQMYGIRFRMPDYFDQPVCFSLDSGMRPDDPDTVRNRRWAHMIVEMRFDVVRLVNVETLRPVAAVDVYDGIPNIPFGVVLRG
jgi:hypothetical protein